MNNNIYPSFIFHPQWLVKLESLNDPDDQYALMMAIIGYGLSGDVSCSLHGEEFDYFMQVVKPDIDKQHAKKKQSYERQKRQCD